MIKRFVIALVLVVIVCGGLIGFNLFRSKMIGEFFANMPVPAVTVSATEVAPTSWTPEIETIGTLWAWQGVDVAVEQAGVVKSIEFSANDRVEDGQLLVQVDDAVERADLISAEAAVERDRAQLERARRLRESGVTAESTLEEAQTAFAESESSLARIRAVMEQKAVEAPFAGTIGIPRIDVGQYVQPGTVIATLQQFDTMKVDFTVPEQLMASLHMGQPASFGLTEEDFPYAGEIIGIDPKVDPQTRLISVRASVENPEGELRPGQLARVRVALPAIEDIIALPQTAVVTSLYGDYVFVVEKDETPPPQQPPAAGAEGEGGAPAPPAERLVAKQVFVEVGRRQRNMIEIVKGLEPGQSVVTSGQNKLANNTPVTIDNSVDPAALALDGGDPGK
ncbi:MAG: efflux RND transporter periplasmic adaptor subunit [Propylenella sp.]